MSLASNIHRRFVYHVYLVILVHTAQTAVMLTTVWNVLCQPGSVPCVRMVTGVGCVTGNAERNASAVIFTMVHVNLSNVRKQKLPMWVQINKQTRSTLPSLA